MNSHFRTGLTRATVSASLTLWFFGAGVGMAAQQAATQPATASPMVFTPFSSVASCPKEVHAKDGCILVTAKNNDKHAFWTKLRRKAYLDVPATNVPKGCMGASTDGSLISAQGEIHFKGTGYYCPNAEAAIYHGSFDETEAQKFGMPVNLTIKYEGGRKDAETITLGH